MNEKELQQDAPQEGEFPCEEAQKELSNGRGNEGEE